MDDQELRKMKEEHFASHDPDLDPIETCPFCVSETWRSTHLCHGYGSSTYGFPVRRKEDRSARSRAEASVELAKQELRPVPSRDGRLVVEARPLPVKVEPPPIEEKPIEEKLEP